MSEAHVDEGEGPVDKPRLEQGPRRVHLLTEHLNFSCPFAVFMVKKGGFNSQVQLSQILFCYPVNFFRS